MKYCPSCQSTYTDDTLQFCLQDGSVLLGVANSENPATGGAARTEAETVVRPRVNAPQNPAASINAPPAAPAARTSNTGLIIFLTALATLLLVGGGIGAWYLLQNRDPQVAVNPSNGNFNKPSNKNSANVNANKAAANISPSPVAANANENENANVNANSSSPTPAPRINEERIKSDVSGKVRNWAKALESGDVDSHMSNYANNLDYYYNSTNAGINAVRSDKERAFGSFDQMRMKISNLRVTTDTSGETATAVFDKEWEFEGAESRSKGKAQSQLQLTRIDGAWRITGERDLKVYYTEN